MVRQAPFRTVQTYATLFAEDGRPMHKSWGNAIEFNEAAEKAGAEQPGRCLQSINHNILVRQLSAFGHARRSAGV